MKWGNLGYHTARVKANREGRNRPLKDILIITFVKESKRFQYLSAHSRGGPTITVH